MKKMAKKIVFIESDGALREEYAHTLESNGFEVRQICDGKEACSCMQAAQKSGAIPDLVIMAIVLSGMDGFDLLEKINEHEVCRNVPKIILTDLDNKQDRQVAFSLGVEEYLIKDKTTPEQLVNVVIKMTSK